MPTHAPGTTLGNNPPYGTLRAVLQHSTGMLGSPHNKYTHVQKQRCPLCTMQNKCCGPHVSGSLLSVLNHVEPI